MHVCFSSFVFLVFADSLTAWFGGMIRPDFPLVRGSWASEGF